MAITIIDYDMGNIGSLQNMIKKAGGKSVYTSDIKEIAKAEKIILPGVGSFDTGMANLRKKNLDKILIKKAKEGTPILAICLGMQLLGKKSEEGKLNGLGLIDAETKKFNFSKLRGSYQIPHMGWNEIKVVKEDPLFKGLNSRDYFYFVHSYHMIANKKDTLTTTDYGFDFVSSVKSNNVYGVQFHPEKSHKTGLRLIKNFIGLI